MKKISNKGKAFYLAWVLVNLGLLLFSPPTQSVLLGNGRRVILYYPREFFYPFTKGDLTIQTVTFNFKSFDLQFYDITEFLFYTIAPIFIYFIIRLLNSSKDETPQ